MCPVAGIVSESVALQTEQLRDWEPAEVQVAAVVVDHEPQEWPFAAANDPFVVTVPHTEHTLRPIQPFVVHVAAMLAVLGVWAVFAIVSVFE